MKILDAAGLKVVTAPYDALPDMVERDRFDCFLRGAHEAPNEVAKHPALAVENDLLVVYPFTSFFFVNKTDAALAEALETGLKKAYADGRFMQHFNGHPRDQGDLRRRTHRAASPVRHPQPVPDRRDARHSRPILAGAVTIGAAGAIER